MKKVTRILGLFCMVGVLAFASSCKKNKETNSSISVSVPQMTETIVDGDRAYIDEGWEFMWHGGDQIMVYNLAEDATQSTMSVFHNVAPLGDAAPLATFQGEDVGAPKEYEYRYFYPVGMVSHNPVELANENRQTFTVSEDQYYYLFDECEPMCMIDPEAMPMSINTDNLHKTVYLKHMFGVGRFIFKAKKNNIVTIESITLTDNFWNLTGDLSVKLHEVDTTKLWNLWNAYDGDVTAEPYATQFVSYAIDELGYLPHPTGKSITLHCLHANPENPLESVGLTLETGSGLNEFNFVLRPLALSEGFTLTLTGTTGADKVPYEKVIDRWATPNIRYATKPGVRNVWEYPAVTEADMHN